MEVVVGYPITLVLKSWRLASPTPPCPKGLRNDLPDFAPEQPAPEPLRAVPLPEKLVHALAGVLPAGEKYAGVDDGASPEEIASAVDAAIVLTRVHRWSS